MRIFPDQPDAHFSLGVIFARKAKFDEALAHYTQAAEIRPDAATHYNLGNVLMKVDRADEAIAHFAEAVRLAPRFQPRSRSRPLEQHVHDFGLSTVEGEYRSGGESDLRFRSSLSVTIEGC